MRHRAQTYEVADEAGLKQLAGALAGLKETLFARVRIAADEPQRVLPSKDGVELKLRFRKAVRGGGVAAVRALRSFPRKRESRVGDAKPAGLRGDERTVLHAAGDFALSGQSETEPL